MRRSPVSVATSIAVTTAPDGLGRGSGKGGGPPDGDGDGDPEKKKRDKEIDSKRKGEFTIDSEYIKQSKSRPRGNMKCEVERFERGTDLTIKDWINQMETYFTIGQIPPDTFVGFMMTKIVPRHLTEIKRFKDLDYLQFREKLVEVFEEPDLATVYLNALGNVAQERDESISDYMHRVRLLVLKAHPDLDSASRERILVTSFRMGLYDRQLAASLAVVRLTTAAEAERLAAEGDAVRHDQRSRRSGSNFLPEGACAGAGEPEDEDLAEGFDDEEDEDLTAAFGDLRSARRGTGTWNGPRGERRKSTSTIKCYGCGRIGHYKSDCPRQTSGSGGRSTARVPASGCLLCGGAHMARDCPQLATAKRAVETASATKSESKPSPAVRTPLPSDSSTAGKRDGALVLVESGESPVTIVDPALPAMTEESTPGAPRMQLFFVLGAVQTLPVWILADSGSVRNLIDEAVFKKLPFQPPIRDPGEVRVIGGNGEALDLKGFAVLPVTLGTSILWHEFGVVPDLPLEVLIGADVLAPHQCSLFYLKNNQKRLQFGLEVCSGCVRHRNDPKVGTSAQSKFVNRNPKRRRNRLRIGSNFLATLPDAKEENCNEEEEGEEEDVAEMTEESASGIKAEDVESGPPAQVSGNALAPASDSVERTEVPQTGKLQKVLADLRVASLPIPDGIRRRLIEVVKEALNAFAGSSIDVGRTSVVVHTIKTGDAIPFRHKLRPVPFARRQYLEQEVEKLLGIGAISEADPGACPYASRTVIAPKKDGSMRMCVDYRDLNAQTEKDSFPLPRIDQVWPTLSRAKYFASLDLLMGYHQVEMDPKDRAKTAFLTHRGLYVYNVMPFGLCNAPATFQRLMEKILGGHIGRGVLVYLDDVLIYAETPEELLEKLLQVLQLLERAGLKCKASKCSLFTQQVNFLGHVISRDGINPEPTKLEKIKQWPRPEKGTGLASFLGLCGYYRDLIPAFAHISDPLYKASRSDNIEWTSSLDASFEQLKRQLLEPRIVRMPDPQHNFILETDASRIALGAVLKQHFEDSGLEHPVGFFSRSLTGSERNYAAYELEMYAVVRAVEHFRVFLLGREFLLRTDHAALRNLLRRDLPPTTRVERWILRLSEYTFKIEYKRGQDNVIADVLSRLPFAAAQERGDAAGTAPERVEVSSGSPIASPPMPSLIEPSSDLRSGSRAETDTNPVREKVDDSAAPPVMTIVQPTRPEGLCLPIGDKSDPSPSPPTTRVKQSLSAAVFVLGEFDTEKSDKQSSIESSESETESESSGEDEEEDEFGEFELLSEVEVPHDTCADLNSCLSTSAPLVDLPISRENLKADDFTIPTKEEFADEQKADAELRQLREWINTKQVPSADELAPLSNRMKALAQLIDQVGTREEVLVIKRLDDPERELILVPSAMAERIIRFYHEGPGGAHQAAKATSAKIIRCFWWPDLKRDVRLYIACCPVCEKFLQLLPDAQGRPQTNGSWRARRLHCHGHCRRQGVLPAYPQRQYVYPHYHRLFYSLRNRSTSA